MDGLQRWPAPSVSFADGAGLGRGGVSKRLLAAGDYGAAGLKVETAQPMRS